MESRWTPETSKSDFRSENSMAYDVLCIFENLLERKCLKWAWIAHLDISNTSYGQKKGWESILTPDQKKSRIDVIYLVVDNVRHIVGKLWTRATTLL
jgi:hypothetical protein